MVKHEREEDEVVQDVQVSSGGEEEDEDEVYVVEKIIDHKKERNGNTQYLIKWEGYPDSENTWEDEDNVFDKDLIKKYWEEKDKAKGARGRAAKANGRTSAPSTPTQATPTQAAKRRKADEEPANEGPAAKSWESLIQEIETIDRSHEGDLIVIINWKDGSSSEHPVDIAYKKCPMRMLKFYEERLRFRAK